VSTLCPEITINGEVHRLKLTLGALANIEDLLGGGDFSVLQERLKAPRVADLILILHALIGGGGKTIAIEALKASDVDLTAAAKAIAEAFKGLDQANVGDVLGQSDVREAPGKP